MVFVVYGFKAVERELGNKGMKGDEQHEKPPVEEIYRTSDSDEANGILQNGGFVKDDEWYVADRMDTLNDEDASSLPPAVNKNDV